MGIIGLQSSNTSTLIFNQDGHSRHTEHGSFGQKLRHFNPQFVIYLNAKHKVNATQITPVFIGKEELRRFINPHIT